MSDLAVGETVRAYDGVGRILDSRFVERRQPVVNLEVHRELVYLVGEQGVLVHNDCWNIAIGAVGERVARGILVGKGHSVIGALQNAAGNGIDLVTRKGGKLFFWEIKASLDGLPTALRGLQEKGARTFVSTRLAQMTARTGKYVNTSPILLNHVNQELLRSGNVIYGGVLSIDINRMIWKFLPW